MLHFRNVKLDWYTFEVLALNQSLHEAKLHTCAVCRIRQKEKEIIQLFKYSLITLNRNV